MGEGLCHVGREWTIPVDRGLKRKHAITTKGEILSLEKKDCNALLAEKTVCQFSLAGVSTLYRTE